MHLQVLPSVRTVICEGFFTVLCKIKMGITKCCTFFPFDVKLEKVHSLHIFQPPLSREQVKVLVYYVKLHKRGEHNGITMNYTRKKMINNILQNICTLS